MSPQPVHNESVPVAPGGAGEGLRPGTHAARDVRGNGRKVGAGGHFNGR
jgi:hypothetical protein